MTGRLVDVRNKSTKRLQDLKVKKKDIKFLKEDVEEFFFIILE